MARSYPTPDPTTIDPDSSYSLWFVDNLNTGVGHMFGVVSGQFAIDTITRSSDPRRIAVDFLLTPGVLFDTPDESGCIVVSEPDAVGGFIGRNPATNTQGAYAASEVTRAGYTPIDA